MNKEKYTIYELIRQSGKTNMFDYKKVIELSFKTLEEKDVIDIMRNYTKYKNKFEFIAKKVRLTSL